MSDTTNKSEKTRERIEAIQSDIKHHRRSIKRLMKYAQGNLIIDKTPYAPRKIKYSRIPRSEARFHWTIQNIKDQVKILEAELESLIKYGE